jgi:hypothetical protein
MRETTKAMAPRGQHPAANSPAAQPQLEYGQSVAWSLCSYGLTDGISEVHRFSHMDRVKGEDVAVACCGEAIPAEVRWFPLLKSLDKCRACETTYHSAEAARYQESA